MTKFQILFVTVCVLSANLQLVLAIDCAGSEYKFKCSDCRTVAVCLTDPAPVKSISCDSPATPYCDNGACTATRPASCPDKSDLSCSDSGYFPHPSDCSKFFYCTGAKATAKEYSCGLNRVYDSKSSGCVTKTKPNQCHIIDCSKNPNAFVHYLPNSAFYAFCSDSPQTNGKKTIVYKCADIENSVFNLQTFACEFKCPGEGRFKTSDTKSFYECWKSGTVLISELWSCPTDLEFDEKANRCLASS